MKKTITALALFLLPTIVSAATLSVSPSSQSVNVGDTFSVTVNLDTQGTSIDGVDLRYLNYNPALLQVQDALSSSGIQITPGSLMAMTLANSVDTNLGRITFSQVAAGGNKYSGSGALASISFKALAVGTANLTFNYTPNNTTDSNVASGGSDILTAVVNGSYIINNPSSSVSVSTSGSSSGSSSSGGGGGSSSGGTTAGSFLTCVPGLSAVSLSNNLSRGSEGVDVTNLQNFLISKGYLAVGNNTGFFGPLTEAALQGFQKAQNIVSSGSVATTGYGAAGPKTRAVINPLLSTSSCAAGTSTTQSLQDQIKILQAMVNELLLKLQSMQR
jgi:hypothetical protein